jgi:multiple sugar transport system permease protein
LLEAQANQMRRRPAVRLPRGAVPWLLLSPAIALSVFLIVVPYAITFIYGFTDAQLTSISSFTGAGFSNFRTLVNLDEPKFSTEVVTTVVFTVVTVVGSLGLGTLLAVALFGLGARTRTLLQALILVPWVVASVITGYTWIFMYQPQVGFLNTLIERLGGSQVSWLLDRWVAIGALAVANVWASFGLVFLIVSAALTNVSGNIIRAAQIDGAGPVKTIRKVILPNIRQAFLLATLVATVSGLNVFDLIFVVTHGGPIYATETLSLLMYRLTFVLGEVGLGAAVTLMLFGMTLLLAIAYVIAWRREERKWS